MGTARGAGMLGVHVQKQSTRWLPGGTIAAGLAVTILLTGCIRLPPPRMGRNVWINPRVADGIERQQRTGILSDVLVWHLEKPAYASISDSMIATRRVGVTAAEALRRRGYEITRQFSPILGSAEEPEDNFLVLRQGADSVGVEGLPIESNAAALEGQHLQTARRLLRATFTAVEAGARELLAGEVEIDRDRFIAGLRDFGVQNEIGSILVVVAKGGLIPPKEAMRQATEMRQELLRRDYTGGIRIVSYQVGAMTSWVALVDLYDGSILFSSRDKMSGGALTTVRSPRFYEAYDGWRRVVRHIPATGNAIWNSRDD